MSESLKNTRENRVWGLQRSGIHAIVNWIIQQSNGITLFINDVKTLDDPYARKDLHWYDGGHALCAGPLAALGAQRMLLKKARLILGFEDNDVSKLPSGYDVRMQSAVGLSGILQNVIIMRDPFNLFASRFGFRNNANRRPMETHSQYVVDLWKCYAREFLRDTAFLKNTVPISFNRWFEDLKYRRLIAETLGLSFTDQGLNSVPGVELPKSEAGRFGCGSSFDRVLFHGRAQNMAVLDRWKRFLGQPDYVKLFSDPELLELSHRIFGHIQGTEMLRSSR